MYHFDDEDLSWRTEYKSGDQILFKCKESIDTVIIKITTKYSNGNVISTSTLPDTCRMVHCDFGWGGSCNGYYVDDVFNLNSDENDYDNPWADRISTTYNHHVRIITYNKPI